MRSEIYVCAPEDFGRRIRACERLPGDEYLHGLHRNRNSTDRRSDGEKLPQSPGRTAARCQCQCVRDGLLWPTDFITCQQPVDPVELCTQLQLPKRETRALNNQRLDAVCTAAKSRPLSYLASQTICYLSYAKIFRDRSAWLTRSVMPTSDASPS